MALDAMNFGDGTAAAERDPLFRHAPRARRHLAWLLLLSVAACSSDDKTSDDDDGKSSGSANADDDDDDTPKKDAGSSTKKDAGSSGGGTMRGDAGHIDAGSSGGGSKSDASGADTGSKKPDSSAGASTGGACTRDSLKELIDQYYAALEAHDSSMVPIASNAKYTENGKTVQVGEGFWKTAGALKFKRSALDTETCGSVTESVVAEGSTNIVLGLRLKVADEKLTEIESLVVRSGGGEYSSDPAYLVSTADDDWETVLPDNERPTREFMTDLVDRYFKLFPRGACGFAEGCVRAENGFVPPGFDCDDLLSCDKTTDITNMAGAMKPRQHVFDVEAGIAAGFTMFQGTYSDFHMFRIRMGKVTGVHAVLARASSSGWD